MADSAITIEKIELQGFRIYLKQQTFNFKHGNNSASLAIFAPNARGKSSLIDAFEYYLSENGTLERLGERASQTHAGPGALVHADAQKSGIVPFVHFWFKHAGGKFDDNRPVPSQIPEAAKRINSCISVQPIIRGHELRSFVEEKTPEKRYRDLAAWFAFDSLLTIQKNLRQLQRQVNKSANSTDKRDERLQDLAKITEGKITDWDEPKILDWLNSAVLVGLTGLLKFKKMSDEDPAFGNLSRLAVREQEQIGLAHLNRLSDTITCIVGKSPAQHEDDTGQISAFEKDVLNHQSASVNETDKRFAAQQIVFDEVWTSAAKLFDEDIELDRCPVCDTEFHTSPNGSRDRIRVKLDEKLSELKEYHKAKGDLQKAETTLLETASELKNELEVAASFEECSGREEIQVYLEDLRLWKVGRTSPESKEVVVVLSDILVSVKENIDLIERRQGKYSYDSALKTVQNLLRLKTELERIERAKSELKTLYKHLKLQAHAFNTAIVKHVNETIGKLEEDTNAIYKAIQGSGLNVPPIRIVLPERSERNQQKAQLLMDFAENHKDVYPSGYLSDSQIHTLALAMRLAAIRIFNSRAPVIALDDIVTSYDTDHRKTIAGVLAEFFDTFQIVLVTHDEQFFKFLQEHLPKRRWNFRRITKIKSGYGPVFREYEMPDQIIEDKLNSDDSAAVEIRHAEEDWLTGICRGFRTMLDIRPIGSEYNYNRSELASSLASFLKKIGLTPPKVSGISNDFIESLQSGTIENFASHFSENPNRSGSIGDEKVRWGEFKYFRNQFTCPMCKKHKFKRPQGMDKPVCNKCEIPFAFTHNDATEQLAE